MGFILHYVIALAAVALMLVGLQAAARAYARRRCGRSDANRIVSILESTPLTQQTALHVVRVEDNRYLIGASPNGLALLAVLREPSS